MRQIAIAIAIVVVGMPLGAARGVERAAPRGLSWDGLNFVDRHVFADWLGRRGVRYTDWARRHPRGVYELTHPIASVARPVRPARASPLLDRARGSESSSRTLRLGLLAVSAALFVAAATGGSLLRRTHLPIGSERVSSVRLLSAMAAAAIAAGAILAWLA